MGASSTTTARAGGTAIVLAEGRSMRFRLRLAAPRAPLHRHSQATPLCGALCEPVYRGVCRKRIFSRACLAAGREIRSDHAHGIRFEPARKPGDSQGPGADRSASPRTRRVRRARSGGSGTRISRSRIRTAMAWNSCNTCRTDGRCARRAGISRRPESRSG